MKVCIVVFVFLIIVKSLGLMNYYFFLNIQYNFLMINRYFVLKLYLFSDVKMFSFLGIFGFVNNMKSILVIMLKIDYKVFLV